MKNNWTFAVIQQWKAEKIKINPGSTPEAISKAEIILDFTFPDDFKELYLEADGFAESDWQPNMFSMWPIERILTAYSEDVDKSHIGFCDYLINSHQIGFLKDKDGVFVLYGKNPDKVADTFSEAIHLIISDSEKIY